MTSDTSEQAIDFLKRWDRRGPWALVAIQPDGPIETRSFYPDEAPRALQWIRGHQGRRNLYFHVNRPSRILLSKATKADILDALALHADLDPAPNAPRDAERAAILETLAAHNPPPSIIVDSGNGYAAYWRIPDDRALRDTELRNEHLQQNLQRADACHSVDHIMRLPGTLNIPNRAKIKKGMTEVRLATVVSANWTYLHDPTKFQMASATPVLSWPFDPRDLDTLQPPDLPDGPRGQDAAQTERDAAIQTIASAIIRVSSNTSERNNRLAQEAFLCGTRLAAAELGEEDVFQRLFNAVSGNDRNFKKDSDTIRRQLREGQNRPQSNDPRIKDIHSMAHTLLKRTDPGRGYRDALQIYNESLQEPLPRGQVDKIAARAAELHNAA